MKRFLVFFLVCFALTVFSEDVYKIALKDGRIVKSDTKPMVNGDRIYFERFGMMLYLPVDSVDLRKTEEGGEEVIPAVSKPATKKATKKMTITDDELAEIKKRARLANEDEIRILEASPAEDGGEGAAAGSGGMNLGQQQGLQGKLNNLMDRRSQAQAQVNDLMNELGAKRDQYGFATMAADKDRLEGEIRDAETRLGTARSQLSSLDNQITATQQEIASTPVVIETNVPRQVPPPPAAVQEEQAE